MVAFSFIQSNAVSMRLERFQGKLIPGNSYPSTLLPLVRDLQSLSSRSWEVLGPQLTTPQSLDRWLTPQER